MLDCQSIAFRIVILQRWKFLAYSDFIHALEFYVDDAIKGTLSIGSHYDSIDECFLNLISLLLLVMPLKFAVDRVDLVQHRLTPDNLSSRIHSQEHTSFAFDKIRCKTFVHIEVIDEYRLRGCEVFA